MHFLKRYQNTVSIIVILKHYSNNHLRSFWKCYMEYISSYIITYYIGLYIDIWIIRGLYRYKSVLFVIRIFDFSFQETRCEFIVPTKSVIITVIRLLTLGSTFFFGQQLETEKKYYSNKQTNITELECPNQG